MLPPQRIMPDFPLVGQFFMAAIPTAAEGSMNCFVYIKHSRHAVSISSSVTKTTSLTFSRMMGKLRVPRDVRKPSAMVFGSLTGRHVLLLKLW